MKGPARALTLALLGAAPFAAPVDAHVSAVPRPIFSIVCRFETAVVIHVQPSRSRVLIGDGDDVGTKRVVAVFAARGIVQHGCRRVSQVGERAFWTGDIFGPWSVREPGRVVCAFRGDAVRLAAYPMHGGGYRLLILRGSRPGSHALFKVELRPRNRGGMWLGLPVCRPPR